MKLLHYGKDGGQDSTVWGFWLVEWKRMFSIALLCFEDGSREAYHSHAFNSVSWVLKGELFENRLVTRGARLLHHFRSFGPSVRPVVTKRNNLHRVSSIGRTWVLTFRGPWAKTWREFLPEQGLFVILASGRRELCRIDGKRFAVPGCRA